MGKLTQLFVVIGAILICATLTGCVVGLTAGSFDFRSDTEDEAEKVDQDLTP